MYAKTTILSFYSDSVNTRNNYLNKQYNGSTKKKEQCTERRKKQKNEINE